MIDVAHSEWSQNLSVLPYNVINGYEPDHWESDGGYHQQLPLKRYSGDGIRKIKPKTKTSTRTLFLFPIHVAFPFPFGPRHLMDLVKFWRSRSGRNFKAFQNVMSLSDPSHYVESNKSKRKKKMCIALLRRSLSNTFVHELVYRSGD